MGKIISLAERTGDSHQWTVEDALRSALDDTTGEDKELILSKAKKVLIIGMDDTGEGYGMCFTQAGMTMSECIALCEVAKARFLQEMGY